VRILLNGADTVSWHRALTLIEGVGPRSSEEILATLRGGIDPVDALDNFPPRKYSTDLRALAGLLRRGRDLLQLPEQLIAEVMRYYEPILKRIHPEDHPKRRKDLDHFATIAARYQQAEQLLADMALEPPTDSVDSMLASGVDDELLTLSTIHSAKGLEWHTVFIIWAAEGRFPSTYVSTDEEMEEERRLMYVAATRAKQELYITYPVFMFDRSLGTVMGKPSRFIDAIPAEQLRPLTLVEEPL
jgi:DNA helicase-2/ATP-dependent DNA helicase PcrA